MKLSHEYQYLYIDDPNIQIFCEVCGDEIFCCENSANGIRKKYGKLACIKCRDSKISQLQPYIEHNISQRLMRILLDIEPTVIDKMMDVFLDTKNILLKRRIREILSKVFEVEEELLDLLLDDICYELLETGNEP